MIYSQSYKQSRIILANGDRWKPVYQKKNKKQKKSAVFSCALFGRPKIGSLYPHLFFSPSPKFVAFHFGITQCTREKGTPKREYEFAENPSEFNKSQALHVLDKYYIINVTVLIIIK